MQILTLNIGSSSVKYKLFTNDYTCICQGVIAGIGTNMYNWLENPTVKVTDHINAINELANFLLKNNFHPDIICHRVVHGGEVFKGPTIVNEEVLATLRQLQHLAPLHNPVQTKSIELAMTSFPEAKQIAFFDTSFHQTIAKDQYLIPLDIDSNIRNYGFHGINYAYIAEQLFLKLHRPANAIICHLGNGASICALRKGVSVATSMGMTPNSGLIMGTRSGSIDPGILHYLNKNHNLTFAEIDALLNNNSGLKAISGSSDMREIEERAAQGDESAILAIEVFVARIRFYLCGYMALVPKPDCIVFTGGIGENSPEIRQRVLSNLEFLNIELDERKNLNNASSNLAVSQTLPVYIIKADEERFMAMTALTIYGL